MSGKRAEAGLHLTAKLTLPDYALVVWVMAKANCWRAGCGLPEGAYGTHGGPLAAAPAPAVDLVVLRKNAGKWRREKYIWGIA